MRLSKNFTLSEFSCKCGCGFNGIHAELVAVLQDLADHFCAEVIVNSACRCKAHNKSVGGSTYSQHIYGTAADVKLLYTPGQIDAGEVAEYLRNKYPNCYGIGDYPGFTHIDVRKKKARWNS